MIQPLFEHRMEFAGYGTRVLELEGSGPPVLMFHGYADSADTWRLTLAQLARRGQRAVAVDLPGPPRTWTQGRSSRNWTPLPWMPLATRPAGHGNRPCWSATRWEAACP
jgi:pimeloyl-ACP methyl ester carboxylesterase